MTLTKLEEARTLSLLTEMPHLISDPIKYVAFGGYVFTYATFTMLVMWTLCGQNLYTKIWSSEENIKILKELNPHDTRLAALTNTLSISQYIAQRIRELLQSLKPEELEFVIITMLEQHTD